MSKELDFKQAVAATIDIKSGYQAGLKALGQDSNKIKLGKTSACGGSVDIDASVKALYPKSNRWDYCFAYKGEVFFVEVHSAITSEVSTVIKKLQWLKDWLTEKAPQLKIKQATTRTPFYWIQSSNFNIPITSRQYRTVVQAGIKPIAFLELK